MGVRMNDNHRTDQEFENFLNTISGVTISHKPHLSPITERRYFGIGNGWLGIVQKLFEVLIKLGWDKSFINVKEKFGGMSIFIDNIPENGFNFIIEAERETFQVCEVCGEDGGQHNINGWIHTLCDEHKDEKLYVEYQGKTYLTKLLEPINNGDLYYNAKTNEIMVCDVNNFFDPWSLKVVEVIKNND
jgi:hypothetical protein